MIRMVAWVLIIIFAGGVGYLVGRAENHCVRTKLPATWALPEKLQAEEP